MTGTPNPRSAGPDFRVADLRGAASCSPPLSKGRPGGSLPIPGAAFPFPPNFTSATSEYRALPGARHGAFTIVVLICLLLSGMLLASLLKLALLHDGQLGHVQLRLQTAWLEESGLERAAARLAVDRNYAGETWTINADRLGGPHDAAIDIRVVQDQSQTDRRLVVVEAACPADGAQRARLTRQTTVMLAHEKK